MARVTVEDCLKYCKNRFHLVLSAADRAHRIEVGVAEPMVPLDNDKPAVLALREIAKGYDVSRTKSIDSSMESDSVLSDRFLGIKAGTILPDSMTAPPLDEPAPMFDASPPAFQAFSNPLIVEYGSKPAPQAPLPAKEDSALPAASKDDPAPADEGDKV